MKTKVDLEELREKIIEEIDMTRNPNDEELHEIIDYVIAGVAKCRLMPLYDRWEIHRQLYDSIRGLGILEELLADDNISEIMINGVDNIYAEKFGRIVKIDGKFPSVERLEDVIQQIVSATNRRVNQSDPIVDTRLPDGSRVNVVLPPVAIDGAAVTIRKFPADQITMEDLIKWGSITKDAADFLKKLVEGGYNIFISGGTGSGKTTFLNALSNYIPQDERIITIEDSAELQLLNTDNLVRMETRQANTEGENEITIRDLIKTALRMRPDRIIVGEVRGAEAVDMLQAMNTGHDGSMCTGHANSAQDMMYRLENMVLTGIDIPLEAIKSQIGAAIDIVVHLGRLRDKTRKVMTIHEMVKDENEKIKLQPLYVYKETGESNGIVQGSLEKTEKKLKNNEKLAAHGIEI